MNGLDPSLVLRDVTNGLTLRQTAPSREMNRFCSCTMVSCICRMAA